MIRPPLDATVVVAEVGSSVGVGEVGRGEGVGVEAPVVLGVGGGVAGVVAGLVAGVVVGVAATDGDGAFAGAPASGANPACASVRARYGDTAIGGRNLPVASTFGFCPALVEQRRGPRVPAVDRTEDHRDALAAVALRGRHQGVLRDLGVAGLEPVGADVPEAVVGQELVVVVQRVVQPGRVVNS